MAALTAEVGSAQPRPWGWQRSTENKRSRKATLAKGDVVILDNLAADKRLAAEKIIRARGAWLLFLRPYSPGLSPCKDGCRIGFGEQVTRHRTCADHSESLSGCLRLVTRSRLTGDLGADAERRRDGSDETPERKARGL
ncbi:hypothetical protein [Mesorhizobium japonicum]|uniref:Mlr3281 protein n=1 Tax=Mesorhizobium japonicum (strain LMG 29417 / CECT 9101 / MAFF 303099) TaxID=266835 RepID=Q98GK7_RHILO|nr:hypothetical protein [Mesorhizobium japonicum]BAB50209.1 mlr3281 [Mesorhizobium japonicum MAFF 303099]